MDTVAHRNYSVDDLVGGMWRLHGQSGGSSASFKRTDSEAAFQEFLKRIPSSANLLQQGAAVDAYTCEQAAHGGMAGVPHVPSVSFLRELVNVQSATSLGLLAFQSSPAIKVEAGADMALHTAAAVLPVHAGAAVLPQAAAVAPHPNAHAQYAQHPPARASHGGAAAGSHAMSYGGNSGAQSAQTSHDNSHDDDKAGVADGGGKGTVRRQRRMLSNRESARRSRRRKQEHVEELEVQINVLASNKAAATAQISDLERRLGIAEDENRRLAQENERFKDELQFLRSELTVRNRRNRNDDDGNDADDGAEPAAKKPHVGDNDEGVAAKEV
ncbi:hypothetical protein FOA52_004576 [Chlamydomonas sp. UWO 241]|nr:hypothetical protein FOA52_004576 [Chlamydomonas sp. UWO 241]